jgi:hypothetical protein
MIKQKYQIPVLRLSKPAMAVICFVLVGATLAAQVFTRPEHTQAATNETINFQARLLTAAGSVVSDGTYNVEFKLYNVSSSGTALWTETRTSTNRVRVVNGYLTVNLASVTAFPTTIDWDQELWLSMNIGGITGSPAWDGEMTPRLKLTSVPFAKRAGALAGGSGANTTRLTTGTPSGNNILELPAETGTLCVRNSSLCGFITTASGVQLQATTPGTPQTGHFNISGTGIVGTALNTPIVDRAGSLSIGTASATSLSIGRSGVNTAVTGLNINLTGITTVTSDNAAAFRVQNSSSDAIFTVDASGNQAILGKATSINGKILLQNSTNANTVTIQSGVTTTSYALTLPTALGSSGACLKDSNGSGVLAFSTCATLQTAYDAGNGVTSTDNRNVSFIMADTATDASFRIILQCDTSCGTNGRFQVEDDGVTVFSIRPGTANGAAYFQNSANTTTAFQIQNAGGDSMLRVNTQDGLVIIGDDPAFAGAKAKLIFGDDCGNSNECVSIFEGADINGATTLDDSDVMQVQGANGIRLSTGYGVLARMVINAAGNVGIGTENATEKLTIGGNLVVKNADAGIATQLRTRTSSGNLDLEASDATDLWLSTWAGTGFTGVQTTWMRFNSTVPLVYVGSGIASTTPMRLVLSEKSTAGDPAGYVGAMYYNGNAGRFRCYETEWKDCVASVTSGGVSAGSSGGTTASATYANLPGTTSVAFTKKSAATKLVVTINTAMSTTVANTSVRLGINIDSTDYDCVTVHINPPNQHTQMSCTFVISGPTAGAKTVQARWRRTLGTGTLVMDTNDWTNVTVTETH